MYNTKPLAAISFHAPEIATWRMNVWGDREPYVTYVQWDFEPNLIKQIDQAIFTEWASYPQ